MIPFLQPIRQDVAYHRFVDTRPWLGVPNASNFWSNLPFVIVGVAGLVWLARHSVPHWGMWVTFFIGVALTGVGSAYYHLNPNNKTLVWDRLPMTISFMPFFAALLAERVNERLGVWLFVPLLVFGVGSVVYWAFKDDLRWYALVQFGPLLAIPVMLVVCPSRYLRTSDMWIVLGWYAGAKVLEHFDRQVFAMGGTVSGHALKHVAAAVGCAWVLRALAR